MRLFSGAVDVLDEDRQYVRDRHSPTLSRGRRRVACLCGYEPGEGAPDEAVAEHVAESLRARVARRAEVVELASSQAVLRTSASVLPGVPTCLVAGPARGSLRAVRVCLGCSDEDLLRVYDLRVAFWDEAASPVDLGGSVLDRVPGYEDLACRALASEPTRGELGGRCLTPDSVFLPARALRDTWVELGRAAGPGGGVAVLVLWRGALPGEVGLGVEVAPSSSRV